MARARRPPVAFAGAGAAARALLFGLRRARWPIAGVARRSAASAAGRAAAWGLPSLGGFEAPAPGFVAAPVVVLAVRDGAIAEVAATLAGSAGPWTGRVVLHLSGALTSGVLGPLRDAGAAVASWHPLATLAPAADETDRRPAPRGIPFFAEGDAPALDVARRLTAALDGSFHVLAADAKPAYHAAATIAGNLLTVLVAAAADVLRGAGVENPEQALALLARQSLEGAIERPGLQALTGPVARADARTVDANVQALASHDATLRLAHAALSLLANTRLSEAGAGDPTARAALQATLLEEMRRAVPDITGAAPDRRGPR